MATEVLRRTLQKTDIKENNNKFYNVILFDDGTCRIEWGRVGDRGQSMTNSGWGMYEAETQIRKKIDRGYREVVLHNPSTTKLKQSGGSAEDELVYWIFEEANEFISHSLAGTVNELSPIQLAKGKQLVNQIAHWYGQTGNEHKLYPYLEEYYNTIPTKLPRKLDLQALLTDFNPNEEEERLLQLEAALSTTVSVDAGNSQYAALGATIKLLEHKSAVEQLEKLIGFTVKNIYTVEIPEERKRYDPVVGNVRPLFHGTRNHNVRHILKSGLRVPQAKQVSNGSRFGRGIYFADNARRSVNYTGSSRSSIPKMMFIADVSLGKPAKLTGEDSRLTAPPSGYDSVHGINSHSGMDEFIIFERERNTIRYVVTLK